MGDWKCISRYEKFSETARHFPKILRIVLEFSFGQSAAAEHHGQAQ